MPHKLGRMPLVRDRKIAFLSILLSVVVVALIDYGTGDRLALSFFYVLPVIAMTRIFGRTAGLGLCFICAAAFPLTDVLAGTELDISVGFWNFTVRAATLITVTVLMDRLNVALAHERDLSRTDSLTQVANTRWFREQAERELLRARRSRKPLTLVFMDLDNFKTVNDDLGHAKGDELLARVGSLLGSCTRSVDIVGRLGGDEFALMLPETDTAASDVVVERVRRGLQEIVQEAGLPASVSLSVGVVTTDAPPESLDALVLVADQLMYSAKRAGKNQVRWKDLHPSVADESSAAGHATLSSAEVRLVVDPEAKEKGLPV